MIISSINNEKIKALKKLKDDKNYLFFDSPKLIIEAMNSGYEINSIIIEESKITKHENIIKNQKDILVVSDSVFKSLSNTVFSQGILAIANKKEVKIQLPIGNFLVLDEVQDPGNVGTLIRSALATGFLYIYLINCANISNDKVIRSTMGALFKTRNYELSREEFVELYKNMNRTLYVMDMDGKNIFNSKFDENCGIVVGNEGNGVSDEIMSIANESISIPMKNGLESLNAAVAGSVAMFNISN